MENIINNDRGIYDKNGMCIGLKPNTLIIDKNEPPMGNYRWKLDGDTWVFHKYSKKRK